MSGNVLLDTNIVIGLFGNESSIVQQLATVNEVFIPCIVLGELYFGARKSTYTETNVNRIDEFASNSQVLLCDIDTSRQYGIIKAQLQAKGKPIPENDLWIAAIAKQHQLTLVTRDSHFGHIEDLITEQW